MNFYNTGNPVPSNDPRDLDDNAKNLDLALNSVEPSFVDRNGVLRKTINGYGDSFSEYLIASGFETTHLKYVSGTSLQVDRASQLIDYNGSVYRVKMPAVFPVILSGVWGTAAAKLVEFADTSFRFDISSSLGSSMIGHIGNLSGSVKETLDRVAGRVYYPETFGATGNGVTDDSTAWNKALLALGTNGGGILKCNSAAKYKLGSECIIPEWVQVDLNGSTLIGTRAQGLTNNMFASGYMLAGIVVNNTDEANDIRQLKGIQVYNGRIKDAYRGMRFHNTNSAGLIAGIEFIDCAQSWDVSRGYCMQYRDCMSSGSSYTTEEPAYKFSKGQSNQVTCLNVRCVVPFGFAFEGGGGGISLIGCDFEGGVRGFYFDGNVIGLNVSGGYFEAVSGVLWDFSQADLVTWSCTGTHNYLISALYAAPLKSNSRWCGAFDESNALEGVGMTVDGNYYPMTMQMGDPSNHVRFRLIPRLGSTDVTMPANVIGTGGELEQVQVRYGSSAVDVLTKAVTNSGLIPLRFSGDVGRNYPNQVAFCTHAAVTPGASAIIIAIKTKIKYRAETMFAKYRLTVVDGNGSYVLAGDLYGDLVKSADATGKVVLAKDDGAGNLQLDLSGFTHPSGVYSCTGTVQICS